MSKKLIGLVLGIMVLVGLAGCAEIGNEVSGYYVSVDINPSIEFVVDEDDVVESYLFLNEDAAIICVDLDFVGMNIDDAVELFVETATAAGYVDPEGEDNAVLITVVTDDDTEEGNEENRKSISERIRKRLVTHFARHYINGVVLTEDFTQEDLLEEAEELGVSPGKLKLAYAAMFTDETLVKEELLELPVKDLLEIVKESHREAFGEFKDSQWERIRNRYNKFFAKKFINSLVLSDEFTQEDLELEAEELGVHPWTLKLVYAALLSDETLVKEDLLELPIEDILAIVREAYGEEFAEFKETQWQRLRERKQEKIEGHRERIQAYLDAHPEMTDEEVEAFIDGYKQGVKEETRQEWQQRIETWKQQRQENQNQNTEDTDDTAETSE